MTCKIWASLAIEYTRGYPSTGRSRNITFRRRVRFQGTESTQLAGARRILQTMSDGEEEIGEGENSDVLARRNQQFDLIDREREQPRDEGLREWVEENQNRQMPRRGPNLAGRVAAANAYDIERLIQQNRELTAHIRAMEERQEF